MKPILYINNVKKNVVTITLHISPIITINILGVVLQHSDHMLTVITLN